MKPLFKKILRFVRPYIEVGGLVISNGSLTFVSIGAQGKNIKKISLKVPAGTIEEGKLVEKKAFLSLLWELHSQITSKKWSKIPVIVSISDADVYTQSFLLPLLKDSNLEEAIRLNMQVISPLDFSRVYSDWQKIGSSQKSTHEMEILSSFTSKELIDSLYDLLIAANFIPVAIEQKAMSIIRLIDFSQKSVPDGEPFFVLYIDSDGLSFSVIRDSSLYFNHFSSWSNVADQRSLDREISFTDFRNLIIQETHRVINFYSGRFSEEIKKTYLITPGLEKEVENIIQDNFSLEVVPFQIKDYPVELSFACALGAALRGTIPRSRDIQISLAPEGTETKFIHSQIISFVFFWRNLIIVSLSVLAAAFLGVFILMNVFVKNTTGDLANLSSSYNVTYFSSLKKEADSFNESIQRALIAKSQQSHWSWLISEIYRKAGTKITINRIFIQSFNVPVILNARAPKESDAVEFKNALETISSLTKVDLPLSSLVPIDADTVGFQVTFYVNR